MADNLTIFGTTYNNVTGIKATDTNGVVQTFTKGGSPSPTPAPSPISSGVQFIDYDGTLLYSYSTADALALSALPANPSHTGLRAQGWNWSLANIKSYLTKYPDGIVNVGQMYTTSDGKTRVYIHLGEERHAPVIGICVNGTVDVDWGDGTTHDTIAGSSLSTSYWSQKHNYEHGGDYVISLTITGTAALHGSSTSQQQSGLLRNTASTSSINTYYQSAIKKVEIGNNITEIKSYAFSTCYCMTNITMPSNIESIGNNAFASCQSLKSLTIPNGVTSIGNNIVHSCYALENLTMPSGNITFGSGVFTNCYNLINLTIPDDITNIGSNMFSNCYALERITIPDDVTNIETSAFSNCYTLKSVEIPDSVESISSSAFQACYKLENATIPDNITVINSSLFASCYTLKNMVIPDDVTRIGNSAFSNCVSLTSIIIPDKVTSIGANSFQYLRCVSSITIPSSVTSIGNGAFQYNYGVGEYHILPTTPPTIGTSAFNLIASDCIIYVPYSADHSILNAYKTASNWSTYADYMQEEPQS